MYRSCIQVAYSSIELNLTFWNKAINRALSCWSHGALEDSRDHGPELSCLIWEIESHLIYVLSSCICQEDMRKLNSLNLKMSNVSSDTGLGVPSILLRTTTVLRYYVYSAGPALHDHPRAGQRAWRFKHTYTQRQRPGSSLKQECPPLLCTRAAYKWILNW